MVSKLRIIWKQVLAAPFSGTDVFRLQMVVAVPDGSSMVQGRDVLAAQLQDIEDAFVNLDIQVDAGW